jgi:effector-binding domain-containing protein
MASFKLVTLDPTPAAVVRDTVPVQELPNFFARAFGEAEVAATGQGVEIVGEPFALYNGAPTDVIDVAGGFRVSAPIEPTGDVVPMELPGGRAVTTVHVGPYDAMAETYHKMHTWMATKGLTPATRMWETYLSDPMTEPDPTAWRTRIVWPVDD